MSTFISRNWENMMEEDTSNNTESRMTKMQVLVMYGSTFTNKRCQTGFIVDWR